MGPLAALFAGAMLVWAFLVARELGNGRMELLPLAAGFAFFQLSNWTIEQLVLHSQFLNKVPRESANSFINTAVSLLHSLLVSHSVALCMLIEFANSGVRMMRFESLYSGTWPGAYSLLAFSCGYFAYDQVDMLRRLLHEPGTPSLLVHHLVLLNCFTLALFRRVAINYLILTLICEIHSVFLHWRRVGRLAGMRKLGSRSVTIEWVLNWTAFFFARTFVHVGISVKLALDATKFPNKSELLLASSGMIGLNILNAFLGLDLIKACSKELKPKRSA